MINSAQLLRSSSSWLTASRPSRLQCRVVQGRLMASDLKAFCKISGRTDSGNSGSRQLGRGLSGVVLADRAV